jgi:hypothetical protein
MTSGLIQQAQCCDAIILTVLKRTRKLPTFGGDKIFRIALLGGFEKHPNNKYLIRDGHLGIMNMVRRLGGETKNNEKDLAI